MLVCLDQRSGTGCGSHNGDAARYCARCGKSLKYALQLLDPGAIVGSYRAVSILGHGGFGAVYLVEDTRSPGRQVALKETFDADSIHAFQGEFDVLSRLKHPTLPAYYEVFEVGDSGYLVMEYVPGQSLADVLTRTGGPLSEPQVLGYSVQLCDALTYLHGQNPPIVHRDIKPANVRLTAEGVIKLVDFGLLKVGGGQTQSSRRGLTPAYAPVEQYGGGTDARSDVYSLGATLYELLTGKTPPPAPDRLSTPAPGQPAVHTLQPPRALNPQLSAHVSVAIVSSLAVLQQDRLTTAQALKLALLGVDPAPVALPPGDASKVPAVPRAAPVVPAPAPTPVFGSTWTSPVDGMVMVYVPAGEFLMGSADSDREAYGDEKPQHRAYLDGFWIDRTPVTNAMYANAVRAGACTLPSAVKSHTRRDYYSNAQYANFPVIYVSWEQARQYAAWAGRRLPTEAEWEKAARGTDGRIYPWGSQAPDANRANFNSNKGDTTAVGSYPTGASPYNALDMAGNVWEWVADWYDGNFYTSSLARNPAGPDSGSQRVLRGGSWLNSQRSVRAAYRNGNLPDGVLNRIGCRCVRSQ